MKIKFITLSPDAPASKFYFNALSLSDDFSISTDDDFSDADYAFFMTYLADLEELKRVKELYPSLKVAIIDPRGEQVVPYIKYCDFLIIDSIEMSDYFSKFSIPLFKYYEFPLFNTVTKNHKDKDIIVIGYHGNKVHLTSMFPKITSALKILAQESNIEFWPVYDIAKLGHWNIGVPDGLKIRHIQWHSNVYTTELLDVDIGIIPSNIPIKKAVKVSRFFLDSPEDYVVKFKMPSNPGRLAVFAKLGIPVVADFTPSHFQFIKEGKSGFLANSSGAWYHALKKLVESAELRNDVATNMSETFNENFDFKKQNSRLFNWLTEFSTYKLNPSTRIIVEDKDTKFSDNLKFNNAYFYDYFFKIFRKIIRIIGGTSK
ncbi:glycosyltransferase [Candidatus Pseudothioglobus singularis]|nr:glycosyltransferase [Candidatus Pseudothioglobus singularis]